MFMHRSIKIPVCFLVLSFFWLVTASLLNFHMHRIFQQDLIPQTLLCKRFKDQIEKKDAGKTLFSSHFSFNPALASPIHNQQHLFDTKRRALASQSFILPALTSQKWPERRGPPPLFS